MKNNKFLLPGIYTIVTLFILGLSAVYTDSYDGKFWATSIFILLALGFSLYSSLFFSKGKDENTVKDMSYITISTYYLFGVFIWSLIGNWLPKLFSFSFQLSSKTYIVIHLLLLVATAVYFLVFKLGSNHMDSTYKEADTSVKKIKLLVVDLEAIKSENPFTDLTSKNSFKNSMEKLIDTVKYSDPISIPELNQLEDTIFENIELLKEKLSKNESFETVNSVIKRIEKLFEERNKKLKILK